MLLHNKGGRAFLCHISKVPKSGQHFIESGLEISTQGHSLLDGRRGLLPLNFVLSLMVGYLRRGMWLHFFAGRWIVVHTSGSKVGWHSLDSGRGQADCSVHWLGPENST